MRILIVLLLISFTAGAQQSWSDSGRESKGFKIQIPRDTIRIHDTIYQPVPLYQVSDTGAFVYLTRSNSPVLKPCFVIRQGFKQNTPQGLQWVEEPRVIGIYSKRWKLIDRKKIQKIL